MKFEFKNRMLAIEIPEPGEFHLNDFLLKKSRDYRSRFVVVEPIADEIPASGA